MTGMDTTTPIILFAKLTELGTAHAPRQVRARKQLYSVRQQEVVQQEEIALIAAQAAHHARLFAQPR
jgi:hypothetical protein